MTHHHARPEPAGDPNALAAHRSEPETGAAAAGRAVHVPVDDEPAGTQAGPRRRAQTRPRRFDHRRSQHPHADPHAAYGPDQLQRDLADQPTPLAHGRRGRAAGTRSDRFNPSGVWGSLALALLACVGAGIGIIMVSWLLIGLSVATLALAGGLAWAFGILNDTR